METDQRNITKTVTQIAAEAARVGAQAMIRAENDQGEQNMGQK